MIEEETSFYEISEKFLVVLDSAIPSEIGVSKYDIQTSIVNKSDLIFDLQLPIEKSLEDIQVQCSIKSAVIPNSQYVINSTNSFMGMGLIENDNTKIGAFRVSLEYGNYDTETLRQELQTKISNTFNDEGFFDIYWEVTYSSRDFRYNFVMNTDNNLYSAFFISFQPVDIITTTSVSQLGTVLGFINDFRYFSGNPITIFDENAIFSKVFRQIHAPYPSNLSGLRAINVIMQSTNTNSINIRPFNSRLGFKNSIFFSNINNNNYKTFFRNNIICSIVCNSNPMEYIFYEKQSDFFIDIKETSLSRIHILLTDTYGNLLELNNQDWTIALEFSILKKKDFKTKSFYEYLAGT
jgi:hypothetical protein